MKQKIITENKTSIVEYAWTIESFNERTGNKCKKFGKNYHQAIDFIVEVK